MSNLKGSRLEHSHHLRKELHWPALQAPAIDAQEHIGSSKGDALVPIYERGD
jgi:hypothetical protein